MGNQMSLFSEAPASHSALREREREWMTRVASWPSSPLELLLEYARHGSCLKTSLDCCRRMRDGTLVPSSGRWMSAGILEHGQALTHNSSGFRSGASACSLSDILETGDIPRRYFLSSRACAGILRRAEKRGKELPPTLRRALEQVAGGRNEPEKAEDRIL